MSNDSVKVDGLDDVNKMLEKVTSTVNIGAALAKCCALVERDAKILAPKDNGDLRRSIASRVEGLEGIVFTPLEYAPYVEYGTGLFAVEGGRKDVPWHYQDDEGEWHSTNGQKPQPFLNPALNQNRKQIKKILKGGITGK